MSIAKLDDRGRLLIPKSIREEYGEEFTIIESLGEIVLIPLPDDPLKTLEEEGKKLPAGTSIDDIKRQARASAVKRFSK